jgi:hypothetical protein
MHRFVFVLLPLLSCLPLGAQDAEAQKKFAGTWDAKFKDKVICTIRVKVGEQISGEMADCSISIDGNGDLQEPESTDHADKVDPMLNPKLQGDTLSFENKDGDDVLKFEMKLVGEGKAELRIVEAPMPVKPIRFERK